MPLRKKGIVSSAFMILSCKLVFLILLSNSDMNNLRLVNSSDEILAEQYFYYVDVRRIALSTRMGIERIISTIRRIKLIKTPPHSH